MPDFNAPGSSALNAGLESPLRARMRRVFEPAQYTTPVEVNGGFLGSLGYRLFDGTIGHPYFTLKTPGGDVFDHIGFRSRFSPPLPHPVTWSIFSGSLPPGLALVPFGDEDHAYIEGTPTTIGTYEFTVQARHDHDNISRRDCRIRIWPEVNISNLVDFNTFLSGISESTDGILLSVHSSDTDTPPVPASYDSFGYDEGLAPVFQQVFWRGTTTADKIHLTVGPGSVPVAVNRIRSGFWGPFTKTTVDEDPAGLYTLPFDPQTITLV
jgi:hypothetical protein